MLGRVDLLGRDEVVDAAVPAHLDVAEQPRQDLRLDQLIVVGKVAIADVRREIASLEKGSVETVCVEGTDHGRDAGGTVPHFGWRWCGSRGRVHPRLQLRPNEG